MNQTDEQQSSPDPADKPSPRSRLRELDLRNTWQIIAGSLLLPFGIAVIIIGWHGAAYGNVDQKQIPYIISGGVLGLAIVVIGCFFYWAHWLYRIYDQADLHHQEAMREQREMIRALIDALGTNVPTTTASAASSNGVGRVFVATATGTNFHTAGCPMVANRGGGLRTVTEAEVESASMKACRVCEPLVTTD